MPLEEDLDPLKPPPFLRLKDGATDTEDPESWDAWAVERTGEHKVDYLKGVEYADIALRKVRATGNPAAATMPLMTLLGKIIQQQNIGDGAIEKGFLDRLISLASDAREKLDQN